MHPLDSTGSQEDFNTSDDTVVDLEGSDLFVEAVSGIGVIIVNSFSFLFDEGSGVVEES